VLNDESIKCWGYNGYGALGQGDSVTRGDSPDQMGDKLLAVNLGTGKLVKSVALGIYHSCARLSDDTVKCWGANDLGQLGLGDTFSRGDKPNQMGNVLPPLKLMNP
jgi:alpha-tubulin suppressor-like RCC1 family protein